LSLFLDIAALDRLFPAHVRTDAGLRILSMGPALARRAPSAAVGSVLSDHFALDPVADQIAAVAGTSGLVTLRGIGNDLLLRGAVVASDDGYVFLTGLVALMANGDVAVNLVPPLTPADMSPNDSARDGMHLIAAQAVLMTAARSLAEEAVAARATAEADSRSKTEFLTVISHQLRDHLHGVIGIIGALGDSPLAPHQAEMVSLIANSGAALTRVVDDVLQFVGGTGASIPRQPPDQPRQADDTVADTSEGTDQGAAAPAAAPAADSDDDDAPVRALVAEDHPANRRIIELMLAPMGVSVTLVANGAEAVDAFKRHDWELVLLDMQMPVLDGVSAARAMRDLEAGLGRQRTPIAMLSANVLPRHVEDAMKAGADHFIAKPVTPTALAQGLDELIRAAAVNAAREAG
jgi:CheY-like chemotaxis protein